MSLFSFSSEKMSICKGLTVDLCYNIEKGESLKKIKAN
ncbi:hypothetical protein SPYSS1447_1921 [Streptococcus pyogenes SS1447]|nr:hypothetical protein SPYSS1447_1921 [Streptococcus pyogenes SS1447]